MPLSIIVVTGASGAGKTAAGSLLETRRLPGSQCFYFDSIGVPAAGVMERNYGGPEQWQAWATHQWLAKLASLDCDVRIAVLDAQTRTSTIVAAPGAGTSWYPHAILFDCADDVRAARLRGSRGQPELATLRMDSWAAYLREQANLLELPIIDTTALTIAEATDQLQALVAHLDNSNAIPYMTPT